MSAVKRFKHLLYRKRPSALDSILDRGTTAPPESITSPERTHTGLRGALQKAGTVLSRDRSNPNTKPTRSGTSSTEPLKAARTPTRTPEKSSPVHTGAGQADEAEVSSPYLAIGPGDDAGEHHSRPPPVGTVAESPGAVDTAIYEEAYRLEVERIRSERGEATTIHSNNRVEKHSHWGAVKDKLVAAGKKS